MKIPIGLVGILWAAGVLSTVNAQTDLSSFPAPRAPFINAVPDRASWTIAPQESSPSESKEAGPVRLKPRVASIESVRTGELKRDVITYQSGNREEIWYFQNQALLSSRPGKVVVQGLSSLEDSGASEGVFRLLGNTFKSPGYPGFKWLDKTHYNGVVLFNKTPSYHYVLKGKDADSGQEIVAAEAWINAQTGAPVAYVSEGALYVYRLSAPPTDSLTLPPDFEKAYLRVKQTEDRRKRLEADAAALQ